MSDDADHRDAAQDAGHTVPHVAAAGHETSDASIRGVLAFLAALVVAVSAVAAVLWMVLDAWRTAAAPPAAVRAFAPIAPTGAPELQTSPAEDLAALRRAEDERLAGCGWTEDGTAVHIPIEQAMELVVERGLPRWGPADGRRTDEGRETRDEEH
jgi:hypothetical protein